MKSLFAILLLLFWNSTTISGDSKQAREVEEFFDLTLKISADEEPLSDFLSKLYDGIDDANSGYGLSIAVDGGSKPEWRITLPAKTYSVKKIISEVCRQTGLTFTVKNGRVVFKLP